MNETLTAIDIVRENMANLFNVSARYISEWLYFAKEYLQRQLPPGSASSLLTVFVSVGIFVSVISVLTVVYLRIVKNRNRFKPTSAISDFTIQQRDHLAKWIDSTEQRINRNNLNIRVKKYFVFSVVSFSIAFAGSLYLFGNLTAAILFSLVFFAVPEYMLSLIEDTQKRKVEDQLVSAVKFYIGESYQKKSAQRIFETIANKVPDPVGGYFDNAYSEIISGASLDVTLSKLASRFQTHYGIMFVQLIRQAQKNANAVELLADLMVSLEKHIELSRTNKASLSGERLQGFIMALLPIPTYVIMANIFPETTMFVRYNYYGRIILTLSVLSIFVFMILDKFIRQVD